MPLFMIERNFAEQLQVTPEVAAAINAINDEESVRWLISFLSADKKKTFCLYEAASAEALRAAARRAGIPADAIVELSQEIVPSGATTPLHLERFALATH
jgi:HEAT repeat protein